MQCAHSMDDEKCHGHFDKCLAKLLLTAPVQFRSVVLHANIYTSCMLLAFTLVYVLVRYLYSVRMLGPSYAVLVAMALLTEVREAPEERYTNAAGHCRTKCQQLPSCQMCMHSPCTY